MRELISGLIITYNEEKNISDVLKCLDFCDEIIIVDSFSEDKTQEIAHTFPNVQFFQNPFVDYTTQRNFALSKAKNDWVLFLDGDERITPPLVDEILLELKKPNKKEAYYFYRKFYFCGQPLKFSGTQDDKNFRLFRKSKCEYIADKKVHEKLKVDGSTGTLTHKLLHYSVTDYDSYKAKMIAYGRLKGIELAEKGKRFKPLTQYLKTGFKFLKSYIFKLGFLDGKLGFQLCVLQASYVFETYRTLKQIQTKVKT